MDITLDTALIGLGRMGAQPSARFGNDLPAGWLPITHAEAIQAVDGYRLAALCDSDPEKTAKYSALYNVKAVFGDFKELINKIRPKVVSIATRTDARYPIVKHALQHGVKGIFAEKPLANNLQQTKELIDGLKTNNVKLAYGATRRAMSIYRQAKELCWSGGLGNVMHISVEFGHSLLMWLLPHATDLINFFANSTDLQEIQGDCSFAAESYDARRNIVDADPRVSAAFIRFGNGVTASIVPINGANVRIGCTEGIVTVHGDGSYLEVNRYDTAKMYLTEREVIRPAEDQSGTEHMYMDLRDAITEMRPMQIITPGEIYAGQAILFGIVQSSLQRGNLIKADSIDPELTVTGRYGELVA